MIPAIIDRLKQQVPELRKVGISADLQSAQADTGNLFPRAYVMQVAEQGGANGGMTNAVIQERIQRFAIVLAARNVRDLRGESASADMTTLRDKVDTALFGWQPTPAHGPSMFSSGRLVALLDGQLWWQDEYTTATQRRAL